MKLANQKGGESLVWQETTEVTSCKRTINSPLLTGLVVFVTCVLTKKRLQQLRNAHKIRAEKQEYFMLKNKVKNKDNC